MNYNFQISTLSYEIFAPYFDMTDDERKAANAIIQKVDKKPGYPCRVSLEDAEIGEEVLLINYTHRRLSTPFDSNGPVYIRKNATSKSFKMNEFPENLSSRVISLRGYNQNEMMIEATTINGSNVEKSVLDMLINLSVKYIQVHFAGPGCFYFRIDRENI